MAEDKKIIVDDDWKNQAKKEKEELKNAEAEAKEQPQDQAQPLPEGDFNTLVSMLATQALFAMGLIGAEDVEPKKDLNMAKFHIDMLTNLEEKTKGNLSDEEDKMIKGALSQLQMGFVQATGK